MKLLMQPKCYTDICLHGKWFHHDHGSTSAYMLGSREIFELEMMPTTDEELELCIEPIAIKQLFV
jgi:hypothetical protein